MDAGIWLRTRLVHAYRTTRLVVSHRVRKVEVLCSPYFDAPAARLFERLVASARNYLEYGSGGSTVLAHRHVACLVSVDSDRHFLRTVRRTLRQQPAGADTILIPVNIGFTEEWGRPVFTKATARRIRRWVEYTKAPWHFFRRRRIEPDLILVDGRFRVACVLQSLLQLSEGSRCDILLDDYSSRAQYAAVEEMADLLEMQGGMARLRVKPGMDRDRCEALLPEFYTDYR